MNPPSKTNDTSSVEIRRGRVAYVDLFEVKENELDLLEKGSPAEIQLNFAIFLLSLAFSSIASLATATFNSSIVQTIFILISIVGILMGAYLLIIWRRTRTAITTVVKIIRSRIEPIEPDMRKPTTPSNNTTATTKETEPA